MAMEVHLVLLRHSMDDLPLAMFAGYDEAKKYAMAVEPDSADAERICEILKLDATTPFNVAIVSFGPDTVQPTKLVPGRLEIVKEFSA